MRLGLDESQGKDVDAEVEAAYQKLRLIWLAFLASVALFFFLTRLMQVEPHLTSIFFWVLLAVGISNLGASFVIKQKLLKDAKTKGKTDLIRIAYIVAFGLCESVALLGLIVFLTTGVQYYYFFFALSGFGMLVHKPQRDELHVALSGSEFQGPGS